MPPTTITLTLPTERLRWLGIGLAVGLVAAIASPVFAPRTALAADDTKPEHTISVSGTGRVVISPDIADLRLGVSVTKPTVKAARAAAAESIRRSSRPSRSSGSPTRTSRPAVSASSPSTTTGRTRTRRS